MNVKMNLPSNMKLCSHCGPMRGPLPLECFDRDRRLADGHRSVCKECRRQQRQPNSQEAQFGDAPNNHVVARPIAPALPAKTAPNVTDYAQHVNDNGPTSSQGYLLWQSIKKKLKFLWLGVLFLGSFAWSSFNGSFAFYDTAKSFLPNSGFVVGALAASILTLGTAVSASWSVKLVQLRQKLSASLMILIFVAIQSLNLIVNHSGVKSRLLITHSKNVQSNEKIAIEALQAIKTDYQAIIEKYPPTDKNGKPVVWKSEITQVVKNAYDEIAKLNSEIKAKQLMAIEPSFEFDLWIIIAWLLLPELCLLTSILVFSMGFSESERT